jgi:hypothetical protein
MLGRWTESLRVEAAFLNEIQWFEVTYGGEGANLLSDDLDYISCSGLRDLFKKLAFLTWISLHMQTAVIKDRLVAFGKSRIEFPNRP